MVMTQSTCSKLPSLTPPPHSSSSLFLLTPPPLSPSLIFLPFCSVLHSLPAFLPFPTCIPFSPSDSSTSLPPFSSSFHSPRQLQLGDLQNILSSMNLPVQQDKEGKDWDADLVIYIFIIHPFTPASLPRGRSGSP